MLFRRKQEITHADTTVRARAKINLTLDVTGRREDGYHTVEMVMQSIALHDTVRVTTIHGEKKPRGIVLKLQPAVSADRRAQSGVPCGGAVLQGDRRTARNLRDSHRKTHSGCGRSGGRLDGCGGCTACAQRIAYSRSDRRRAVRDGT